MNDQAPVQFDPDTLDWSKSDGLIPAIIQDAQTLQVLMLGYVNREAVAATIDTGLMTFWSRSKKRLWRKGETSGNSLEVVEITPDCDSDALLVLARPAGPACHLNTTSCFGGDDALGLGVLARLAQTIQSRKSASPDKSYTAKLLDAGQKRIAQKIGEEGVETALALAGGDTDELVNEAADLTYHLLVGLTSRGVDLSALTDCLRNRAQ